MHGVTRTKKRIIEQAGSKKDSEKKFQMFDWISNFGNRNSYSLDWMQSPFFIYFFFLYMIFCAILSLDIYTNEIN